MLYNLVHSLLKEAENVNAYGLFSFLLFFGFFAGVLVWAWRLKKNYLNHMGGLPLDGGEKNSTDKTQS
jgi:cytochrome c oxidase cbb3-type subunit IV